MADVEIPDPEEIKELGASRFTKTVAMSTAVIAVGLAVASVGGSNAGKDMMKEQIQASNEWARYQAKAIRERMAEQEIRRLQIEFAGATADRKDVLLTLIQHEIEYYAAERNRYKKEKDEIEAAARSATGSSLTNQRKDGYFDVAEMLLQISIVMASVSMLSSSRAAYAAAVVLAILGGVLAFNGFTLTFKIDALEPETVQAEEPAAKNQAMMISPSRHDFSEPIPEAS